MNRLKKMYYLNLNPNPTKTKKSHEQEFEDNMEVAKRTADFKNAAKKPNKKQSRFTMFVKLKSNEGIVSYWPNMVRVWCLRGDQYTDIPKKMLKNLINHAKNNLHKYSIIELYDNDFATDDEEERRVIMKYQDGITVKPLLPKYKEALIGFFIPKQFR